MNDQMWEKSISDTIDYFDFKISNEDFAFNIHIMSDHQEGFA